VRVGEFNAYGSLRNVTISGGSIMTYGSSSNGIGTIRLNGGNIQLAQCDDNGFNSAISGIKTKITYTETDSSGNKTVYGNKDKPESVEINTDGYPWQGGTRGCLNLNDGDRLVFHVDSSKDDAVEGFKEVKGYVYIDESILSDDTPVINFGGGKLAIFNEDLNNVGVLPEDSDFWLIRAQGKQDVQALAGLLGFDWGDFESEPNEHGGYKMTSNVGTYFANEISPYAQWNETLDVYLFDDDDGAGLYVGSGETPRFPIPTDYSVQHANQELVEVAVNSIDLVTDTVHDRMTGVKGSLNDPFIHILYGHGHQDEIAGFGYNNNSGGVVVGLDYIWHFVNDRHLKLGAVLGYVHGKTNFFGSATGLGKSAKHDIYTAEVFGALETFNDKHLKTNLGVIIGYSHIKDNLHRVDPTANTFDGKITSNSVFIAAEFVKNFCAYKGYNFGLWARGNYYHINQGGYNESTAAATGAQHVSSVKYDTYATVLGINLEKEILFNPELVDKTLSLSLKAGWEHQMVKKHSTPTVSFDNAIGLGQFVPTLSQQPRNSAIISLESAFKLNTHWTIVGSYVARFNKDAHFHNVFTGIEYGF
jgi:hypothetical protein